VRSTLKDFFAHFIAKSIRERQRNDQRTYSHGNANDSGNCCGASQATFMT
jgi:hypothetical protein